MDETERMRRALEEADRIIMTHFYSEVNDYGARHLPDGLRPWAGPIAALHAAILHGLDVNVRVVEPQGR
jgi:hypothetical protein